ncbi:ABC-F type ribosomal protection protein [Bacillus luteolus]|uniref:ABC-F type ribosomal protection protein n=1 Tax=Litchfieldia luteola TaxID=682179 RepID=A0ABR9QM75_9BACI|nr:ABC-F type ribosomal protection protein [Cytobacillus luteolus]MBE4909598.1 ABC-F type ribosomal protection protein [Cytobacillus luteolus]MBP1940999.1 macrolide transport system ATP-binding/permease protein [Cytobacillus luteolus]
MTVMKIRDIKKSFGDKVILEKVNADIKKGDRIGLVGNNGAGKTTLANILYGSIQPDSGTVNSSKQGIKMGFLLQSTEYTVTDFKEVTTSHENELLKNSSELGLKKVQEWDGERLKHLSGGEKLKLSLARIWAAKPDVLILDEPTNHLDYQGVEWLVGEIKQFSGTVIIISHDRYFMDQTVNQVVELENGISTVYKGNYSEYREEKERRNLEQMHHYEVQQKRKEKVEQQIENLQNWSDKAHKQSTKQDGYKEYYRMKAKKMDVQVKSKRKRLEKELEKNKVEKPVEDCKVNFQFGSSGKRGNSILEAKGISKSFEGRVLFEDSHFYIKHGERIGIFGENGCGKTTLIKTVLGQIALSKGELWKSDSLKIGYLSQDVDELDTEKTALEILGITERDEISRVRTIFANIGLKEDKITKPISTLSLGERTRVKLVGMLLKNLDLLILDEPTNHLDLVSRESLEKTLEEFAGTILVISHDVYFMNKLCDKLLVFENKKILRVEKSLTEYLSRSEEPVSNSKEELLVLQNKITALLGEISLLTREDPKYNEIDQKLSELLKRKREIS